MWVFNFYDPMSVTINLFLPIDFVLEIHITFKVLTFLRTIGERKIFFRSNNNNALRANED